ncbi:TetR/AcrR family transcriptional regulator [Tomitella biformata]|uniref:TetR/AcrR family transcriptional regulator n=1 Tax=Tomitella biformata TaxID=630403 RepID=UPI000466771F|nr:TetR/AcrR family transcriptional regulator [Tomitella biformata]
MTADSRMATVIDSGESGRPSGPKGPPKRRPKNRKSQIAAVAAEAFSERGYHAVGVDDIAGVLGISGPALYRHFPNKYALFQHAVLELVNGLLRASALPEPADDSAAALPAGEQIDQILSALIQLAVENRRTGGLYRWEGRFLHKEDLAYLKASMSTLNQRLLDPLAQLRPTISADEAKILTATILSISGSITAHRAPLSAKRISPLLLAACWAVLAVDLPVAPDSDIVTWAHPLPAAPAAETKREALLRESLHLFYRHGYHEVSIEQIANAAGITASGLYRSYDSKLDLLEAIFQRAATRLEDAQSAVLGGEQDAEQKLNRLVEAYTDLSFQQSELLSVYFAEIANLPGPRRAALHSVQRKNIEIWSRLLWELRPELMLSEARYLVHAAFGLVLDLGRLTHFDQSATVRLRVRTLMLATLLGHGAKPA